jgi:predicted nucleotidyltransferase
MYGKMNITENHLRVLSLFTKGLYREFYVREAQKILKMSLGSSQKILGDIERRGVLESQTRGKIKVYRLRKTELSIDYLLLAEDYKKISFLQDKPMIREILAKITPFIRGTAMVFGSYAKETQSKDSDLDIFIIGDYDKKEIRKISQAYGIEVSIKSYPLEAFRNSARNDFLVKEIIDNHVLFLNGEAFIREVFEHG